MEDIGAYYLIVLNDPKLRRAVIADAERSAMKAQTSWRLRVRLANALSALAVRIQPRATETTSQQPVFVE